MRLFKPKYHVDDLIIEILLSNLEYKKVNQIQDYRVYTELGLEARKKCDELIEVLEETEFIKRIDSKNAELTLSGLNVKNMGGWLKYQDSINNKNKRNRFFIILRNVGIIVGIILSCVKIVELSIKHMLNQSNNQEYQEINPASKPEKLEDKKSLKEKDSLENNNILKK